MTTTILTVERVLVFPYDDFARDGDGHAHIYDGSRTVATIDESRFVAQIDGPAQLPNDTDLDTIHYDDTADHDSR